MASSQQSTPEEQCELDLAPEPTCMELLEQVRAETNLVLGNEDGEAGDAATEQDQRVFDEGEIQDSHLDVPDRDVLETLLSNTAPRKRSTRTLTRIISPLASWSVSRWKGT